MAIKAKKNNKVSSVLVKARKRFKKQGFDEDTIAQAVRWARKRGK
jgi:hypothetical protein